MIENYFPSLGLSFEKIPEQKKKKTPDGYILHNQQRIALVEIKFLEKSKRELKCNSTDEYLHTEIFNERMSSGISRAKSQLEIVQNFNGPKIIYFITKSHEAYPSAFQDAILGIQCIEIDEGKHLVYAGHAKEWDMFADGFLTAIFCFSCNPQHKHELWLYENRKSKYPLPSHLLDKKYLKYRYT
ncbi:MAG: hypothetical protein AAB740_05480 [Patescibacteria group bacterium]